MGLENLDNWLTTNRNECCYEVKDKREIEEGDYAWGCEYRGCTNKAVSEITVGYEGLPGGTAFMLCAADEPLAYDLFEAQRWNGWEKEHEKG